MFSSAVFAEIGLTEQPYMCHQIQGLQVPYQPTLLVEMLQAGYTVELQQEQDSQHLLPKEQEPEGLSYWL